LNKNKTGVVEQGSLNMRRESVVREKVQLTFKQADGYVIPLGALNLVLVVTDVGMVGCGAFDVDALDGFEFPAARVKSVTGGGIGNIDDLLGGEVKDANEAARALGIQRGMSGKEALDRM
jgi:uncharacterized protein YunC (DUF1805 family)